MVAPGSGHAISFHPSGNYLYRICELTATIHASPTTAILARRRNQTIGTVRTISRRTKARLDHGPSSGKFLTAQTANLRIIRWPMRSWASASMKGQANPIGHTTENIQFPRLQL
jgi:hypothetical protein